MTILTATLTWKNLLERWEQCTSWRSFALEQLTSTPFLRHLSVSPAFITTLRELTLGYRCGSETVFDASLLCQVLSDGRRRLEHLGLQGVSFDAHNWTLLSSTLLRSNSLTLLRTLELMRSKEVSSPQPQGQLEQPHEPPLHHILDLRLTPCKFNMVAPQQAMELGNMLRSSLLQHFTLDMVTLGGQRQDFFDVLNARDPAICLQSLHLSSAFDSDLFGLAPYIVNTVHLRDLTVRMGFGGHGRDVMVPVVFLSSLRRNGSLHNVDLSSDETWMTVRTPNAASLRRIQAYTTRNRVLPPIMATTSFGSNASRHPRNGAEPPAAATFTQQPSASAFPTLGAVSQHTPRVAPNTFLKAFLAASVALSPASQQRNKRTRA